MPVKPLIRESLMMLNICGLNPTNQNTKSRIRVVVSAFTLGILIVELLLQMAFGWKGWKSVEEVMLCSAIAQAFSKIIYIWLKKEKISKLLENIKNFLFLDDLQVEFQQKIRNMSEFIKKSMRVFLGVALAAVFGVCLKPLLGDGKTLPFNTFHPVDPETSSFYFVMYTLQVFQALVSYVSVLGFDFLFLSFIILMVFELKVVKEKFSTLDVKEDNCLKTVGELVNRHNLVLRCIKNINEIYSELLLIQFSSSIIFICNSLLGIVVSGFPADLKHVPEYLFFLSSALSELFIYCVAGTCLISESESVSEAIYASDWWVETQPKFRTACVMIIQRSNKTERLTAGGMFILNLESFTKIVRFGLSFFSLTQAMTKGTGEK